MRKVLPILALLTVCIAASPERSTAQPRAATSTALDRVRALRPFQMDEVLWLARAVYSESNRADEQELVAWVIRNRVETGFRGTSYREVVLEPLQFSAFNSPSERRDYILGLDQHDAVPSWMSALDVSLRVYEARPSDRPFPIDTRHFYSPVSMVGRTEPAWASAGVELSSLALGVDPDRFRFFSGIDQGLDMSPAVLADAAPAPQPTSEAGTSQAIDQKMIEQQMRAAERETVLRTSIRSRRFSGKVRRPSRPSRRAGTN